MQLQCVLTGQMFPAVLLSLRQGAGWVCGAKEVKVTKYDDCVPGPPSQQAAHSIPAETQLSPKGRVFQ